jgi:hypothetical protein
VNGIPTIAIATAIEVTYTSLAQFIGYMTAEGSHAVLFSVDVIAV